MNNKLATPNLHPKIFGDLIYSISAWVVLLNTVVSHSTEMLYTNLSLPITTWNIIFVFYFLWSNIWSFEIEISCMVTMCWNMYPILRISWHFIFYRPAYCLSLIKRQSFSLGSDNTLQKYVTHICWRNSKEWNDSHANNAWCTSGYTVRTRNEGHPSSTWKKNWMDWVCCPLVNSVRYCLSCKPPHVKQEVKLSPFYTRSRRTSIDKKRLEEAGVLPNVLDDAMAQFIVKIIILHGKEAKIYCDKDPYNLKHIS